MCGIIITSDFQKTNSIQHRGIEKSSYFFNDLYYVHHRLPIQTEPGDKWSQPIQTERGFFLFNGEIFNIPSFFSSDVEYLQSLFDSYSNIKEMVENEASKWDGFWAIIYCEKNLIYCFTDPLGKKQLYYNDKEICSEIRPLIDKRNFDYYYKSSVYKFGYNINNRTPWEGVYRILPNKLYVFNIKNFSPQIILDDYFKWFPLIRNQDLKELILTSVQQRLVSKTYGIGCLISGGLDSSIIAWALKELDAPVKFYSIENNEKEYIELLANHLNICYKYLSYDSKEDIYESFKFNETPIDLGSVLPQHKLFSVIPERIVLSGDGADELFGGYKRINEYDSQLSDIFDELVYYHLPRLDRASMRYTIELRTPFLSHNIVRYALNLPYYKRKNKKILKDVFKNDIPKEIIERDKVPLKNPNLIKDSSIYKKEVFDLFYNEIFKK